MIYLRKASPDHQMSGPRIETASTWPYSSKDPIVRAAVLGGAVLVPRRPITLAFNGVPFLGSHQNVSRSLDYGA